MEQFRWFTGGWRVNAELPVPASFEMASRTVREEDVAAQMPCGPDLGRHLAGIPVGDGRAVVRGNDPSVAYGEDAGGVVVAWPAVVGVDPWDIPADHDQVAGGFTGSPPTSRREDLIRGAPRPTSATMGERRARRLTFGGQWSRSETAAHH